MADDFRYEGFRSPNGTIVPDDVFDVLMPRLADAELRVLLYIIRRTFGFKKESDDISLKQMVEGITTKDGRVLDQGTGLSKPTVARGLAGLRTKQIIVAVRNRSAARGNEATTYQLRFKGEAEEVTLAVDTASPLSQQRDTQQTVEQQTDFDHSNIRMTSRNVDNFETTSQARAPVVAKPTNGVEAISDVLARRRGRPQRSSTYDEDRQVILAFIQDFAREFNDRAPLRSSVTRAYNLQQASGLHRDAFIDRLYQARALVQERSASIRSTAGADGFGLPIKAKMPFFFAVLEDILELRDEPPSAPAAPG